MKLQKNLAVLLKINIIVLIFLSVCLLNSSPVDAADDNTPSPNNKHGVHILFPEEIDKAALIANGASNQAEWGYITIVIQSTDKNLKKWQKFMDRARELKLIPIIRLATYPVGPNWSKPTTHDFLDWANFLRSLDWPVKKKIVVVYNEPNHAQEWGGQINPQEYARHFFWTKEALLRFDENFLILPAGLDLAANNSRQTMDAFVFRQLMAGAEPDIFKELKAFASHSYPNPSFSSQPYERGRNKINGFLTELDFFKQYHQQPLEVYITETGWSRQSLSEEQIASFYQLAYQNIWNDPQVKSVTPFIFSAQQGPFTQFSIINPNNDSDYLYKQLSSLPHIVGKPEINQLATANSTVAGVFVEKKTLPPAKPYTQPTITPNTATIDIFKNIFKYIFDE